MSAHALSAESIPKTQKPLFETSFPPILTFWGHHSIAKEIADDDILCYYMYNTQLILSEIVFLESFHSI